MEQIERIKELNQYLLEEMPDYKRDAARFAENIESQRRLLRSLMNVRYPNSQISPHYIKLQDELLTQEKMDKGIVDVLDIPVASFDSRIAIWQGDITRLDTDAIVNAAIPKCWDALCHVMAALIMLSTPQQGYNCVMNVLN
jgi:predicted fused transcriptional regulator/phosphomethylpyrimidine kinase